MSSSPRLPLFLKRGVIDPAFLKDILDLIIAAGDAVMDVYGSDFVVSEKDDHSPVTEADIRAEAIISEGLAAMTPDIPIVAEEARAAAPESPIELGDCFWLVDPLDGTKEFVSRNGEFTVNVGLVYGRTPVFGVVHAPALETTYWGARPGSAVMRTRHGEQPIQCRPVPKDGATVIGSRRHGDPAATAAFLNEFLKGVKMATHLGVGSSLKFCKIAEGVADVYPRLGPTSEWDTAAAHAVLNAAGGKVTGLKREPLVYGKSPDFRNPYFVAFGPGL